MNDRCPDDGLNEKSWIKRLVPESGYLPWPENQPMGYRNQRQPTRAAGTNIHSVWPLETRILRSRSGESELSSHFVEGKMKHFLESDPEERTDASAIQPCLCEEAVHRRELFLATKQFTASEPSLASRLHIEKAGPGKSGFHCRKTHPPSPGWPHPIPGTPAARRTGSV